MVSSYWKYFCDIFSKLVRPSRRKTRVSFSPSTLQREIMLQMQSKATVNPFLNFLAEIRAKAMMDSPSPLMPRDYARLSQTAGKLWNSMNEDAKQPYRSLALEQKKLRRRKRKYVYTSRRKLLARRRKRQAKRRLSMAADGSGDG